MLVLRRHGRCADGYDVIVPPKCQYAAGMGQAVESGFVQAFIAQAPVKALGEGVLLRLARIDIMPSDA